MSIQPSKTLLHLLRLYTTLFLIVVIYLLSLTPIQSESICYWYNTYDILCPMCGGTRSLIHFMTLHFKEAYMYNPVLTLSVYPIGLFLLLQDSIAIVANCYFKKKYASLLLYFINLLHRKGG